MSKRSLVSATVGILCAGAALWPTLGAEGAQDPNIPNFHPLYGTAWLEIGDELLAPPSGPGPVTNDPRYPYVDNGAARRAGIQPTYRVADLNNPILQSWAKEQMKKANDEVRAGKVPFRPRE
jgi:hypothetical protein